MSSTPRQSFFHVDCFKCAKCGNQVTADTNLLLLSDGSPICANCSYSCNVCKQPILDEAIMTGDDSYHAHCFKCKVCKNRIDELVFAKTSQGIYCMNCHNERVARSKRHQARKQEQRERERAAQAAAAAGRSGSMNGRQGDSRDGQNGQPHVATSNVEQGRRDSHTNSGEGSSPDAASPYGGLSRSSSKRAPGSSDDHSAPSSANASRGPTLQTFVTTESQHRQQEQGAHAAPSPRAAGGTSASSSSQLLGSPTEKASIPLSKRHSGMFIGLPSSPSVTRVNPNAGRPSTAGSSSASSSPIEHLRSNTSPSGARMDSLSVPNSGDSTNGYVNKRKSFDNGVRPLNVLRPSASSISLNTSNGTPPQIEHTRSLNGRGRDSPRPYSPLRDYFAPYESTEPQSYAESDYQESPISPAGRNLHDYDTQHGPAGRARSASSSAVGTSPGTGKPPRPTLNLDKMPSRSTSLAIPSSFEALEAESPSNLVLDRSPRTPEHHRRPPSLNLNGSNLRADDREQVRHSALSGVEFEMRRPGSGSSLPPSPSHFVDVPHSIESGTDTEAESDENGVSSAGAGSGSARISVESRERPPSLPPKEFNHSHVQRAQRPGDLRVDVGRRVPSRTGTETEDNSADEAESSPVERTSHSTFIAPALPPIRISMGGADFSDFIKTMSAGGMRTGDKPKVDFDVTLTPPDSAGTTQAQPATPRSDSTILGFNDPALEETPVKRSVSGSSAQDTPRRGSNDRARMDTPGRVGTPPLNVFRPRERVDSNARRDGANGQKNGVARITVTAPADGLDGVRQKLQEAVAAAEQRGSGLVSIDGAFAQSVVALLEQQQNDYNELKRNLDGMKRTSKQYMDGLTVAQTEYDRELKARRDAEAEVTRLRVLLSGQMARLTAISGESKKQEAQKQLSREWTDRMSSLERDLSKLKVERDMTLAEVEQLSASRSSFSTLAGEDGSASLTRALSMRFDNIKTQYQHELVPLNEQREALIREIAELKATRDALLEETTVLNQRNEELAQLASQYQRRLEAASASQKEDTVLQERRDNQSFDRARSPPMLNASASTTTLAATDESAETKFVKITKPDVQDTPGPAAKARFIKWPGSRAPKENVAVAMNAMNGALEQVQPKKWRTEHVFQQISVLRVARCDHCGDKMWGSQLRCTMHTRCIHNVNLACSQQSAPRDDGQAPLAPLPPSIFGRDLIEQVRADSKDEPRVIPVIVEKCIDAVDHIALDLEGIYRKTGGSGQSKMITQLFERGEYQSFDLRDSERFNDICSVTSVLKSYLRSLPNPLLTFELHDKFIGAATIRDPAVKANTFADLVHELPREHYHTLRALMLHLHRVCERSERNLMHARNLGVVFGPTLMRSRDPSAEFSDMAGKALCIEWLVENAPRVFEQLPPVA
ncbi:RhoGAP-domain-containing protein [Trametes coccinea BRFM310]|uniref:RhoGAP-domain-containing protein n=1 Tax=Trametes coccinea (strain BRFM310) TaxID=1353009 RepID=A0A1Y2J0B0_TRAC3|nr:RhoGAP-domain-containing protein [Trametes coccinea BRFM310]